MKGVVGCVTSVITANILLGGIATKYMVEFWGSLYRGAPVDMPFWIAAVSGLFIGQFTVPGAIVTWLISFIAR